MRYEVFHRLEEKFFYGLTLAGCLVVGLGLLASWHMEEHGHVVSGMSNQVVWGTPHIFAIFMIVAASGVLNVASIGSVFGKGVYKTRAPLSGLLSIALLAGGLAVLLLDLGRPDRMIVALTHFNFKSIFTWNILLYTGLFAVVAVYLWTLMERRMNRYSKYAGFTAFFSRLILTTCTGSIFGFLVARQAFSSAVLAPTFIVMSFAWGLAAFIIAQSAMYSWNNITLHPDILRRMRNLLGLFVAGVLYLVTVYHLTNLYFAKQADFERFILWDGGVYPVLFWAGYVLIGSLLPLFLIYHPKLGVQCRSVVIASILVIVGAFALLYVLIVGGQAFPLDIFPGMDVTSSFLDGEVDRYVPHTPELFLGLGGLGVAFVITAIGMRVLHFLPQDDFGHLPGASNITD
ncbi:MAG: NrfD/PsrC family molybdoenzyme membrane anchor subunit [Rhodocyclaceae bacterium]